MFFSLLNLNNKAEKISSIPTIKATDIISSNWGAVKDDFFEKVHGKHVFIGANLTGAEDTVESPVYGDIPGVFLHAVALQNLIYFEEYYYKKSPENILSLTDLSTIIEIFTILLSALVFLGYKVTLVNFKVSFSSGEHLSILCVAVALNLLVIFTSVWLTLSSRIAPTNFLGLLILAPMIYQLVYFLLVNFFNWIGRVGTCSKS